MTSDSPHYLTRADGLRIAYRMVKGKGPTLVFLPGYMSDMQGGKAQALEAWAIKQGGACLRLDYSGCGESEGDFKDGTLSRWRDDVLLAIELLVRGPVVLVGSSMGGWLMLMVGEALESNLGGSDLAGMVGIAAAPDFTRWGFTDEQRTAIYREGVVYEDNPYGLEPTPTWRGLYEDGEAQLMLDREIAITCPVRLLHGQADADVPWEISVKLAGVLQSDDVRVTLIKDGDHRLSRDQDIELLLASLAEVIGG
jgi:pimeloyl-ACP methyl ester carboxylesterase